MCKYKELQDYANAKISEYDLDSQGWSFRWNNKKRAFGTCCYGPKTIELSRFMVDCGEPVEAMKTTLRHEIAHALAGPTAGHGPVWKRYARMLDVPPVSRRRGNHEPKGFKWFLCCPECDYKRGYFRKPSSTRRRSCGQCCPTFNERYELVTKRA